MNFRESEIFNAVTDQATHKKSDIGGRLEKITEQEMSNFLGYFGQRGEFDPILSSSVINSYQKGILASQLTKDHFQKSGSLKEVTFAENKFGVMVLDPDWGLCSDAEPRFRKSVKENAVMIVPPGLALKFVGRLTALCYETFSTENGTFVAGNWYSPATPELRRSLDEKFEEGVRVADGITEGSWGLIREYNRDPFKDKTNFKALVADIPQIIEGDKQEFKEFREREREEQLFT